MKVTKYMFTETLKCAFKRIENIGKVKKKCSFFRIVKSLDCTQTINLLPDMPILGSSNSAANKGMMAKVWTNGDIVICLSRKHCGKKRNCSLRAISFFSHDVSKTVCC